MTNTNTNTRTNCGEQNRRAYHSTPRILERDDDRRPHPIQSSPTATEAKSWRGNSPDNRKWCPQFPSLQFDPYPYPSVPLLALMLRSLPLSLCSVLFGWFAWNVLADSSLVQCGRISLTNTPTDRTTLFPPSHFSSGICANRCCCRRNNLVFLHGKVTSDSSRTRRRLPSSRPPSGSLCPRHERRRKHSAE